MPRRDELWRNQSIFYFEYFLCCSFLAVSFTSLEPVFGLREKASATGQRCLRLCELGAQALQLCARLKSSGALVDIDCRGSSICSMHSLGKCAPSLLLAPTPRLPTLVILLATPLSPYAPRMLLSLFGPPLRFPVFFAHVGMTPPRPCSRSYFHRHCAPLKASSFTRSSNWKHISAPPSISHIRIQIQDHDAPP